MVRINNLIGKNVLLETPQGDATGTIKYGVRKKGSSALTPITETSQGADYWFVADKNKEGLKLKLLAYGPGIKYVRGIAMDLDVQGNPFSLYKLSEVAA